MSQGEDETDALVVKSDDEPTDEENAPPEKGFFERLWDKIDADEVFSYDTPKTLRLLDRRLGLINLVGRTLIWLYIVVYVLLLEGRMFDNSPGYGPAMVKVVNDTYVYANAPATPGADLAFTAFDSTDVVTPFIESNALFVMTQLEKQQAQQMVGAGNSRRLLSGSDPSAGAQGVSWEPPFGTGSVVYELQGVEYLKIRYFATMSFPSVDPLGSDTHESSGGFVGSDVELGENAITVEELLESAGLTIDQVQKTGAILQVNLVWDCMLFLPQIFGDCSPTIKAVRLDEENEVQGFSLWRTRHYVLGGDEVRDLEQATGLRLLWRSVGTGRQLDPVALIFHLAAGVALLPLAAVVTEIVMWYGVPERKHYERNLYSETPDFYKLDDIKLEREERAKRKKEEGTAVDVEALFSNTEEDDLDEEHAMLQ